MKAGQKVRYSFYGKTEIATVNRTSRNEKILFLNNGRWMHSVSCKPVGAGKAVRP